MAFFCSPPQSAAAQARNARRHPAMIVTSKAALLPLATLGPLKDTAITLRCGAGSVRGRPKADFRPAVSLFSGRDRSNCTDQRHLDAANPCHTCTHAVEFPIRYSCSATWARTWNLGINSGRNSSFSKELGSRVSEYATLSLWRKRRI